MDSATTVAFAIRTRYACCGGVSSLLAEALAEAPAEAAAAAAAVVRVRALAALLSSPDGRR